MAVVEMNKISLIGLNKDKEQILESLMKVGIVELLDVDGKLSSEEWSKLVSRDGDAEGISQLDSEIEKLDFALGYLDRYDTRRKGLFESKRTVTEDELKSILAHRDKLWAIVRSIMDYDEQLSALKAAKNRSTNLLASLDPWKPLSVPLEVSGTQHTTITSGVLPAASNPEELRRELEEEAAESFIHVVNQDREQFYLLVIYHNAVEDQVLKVLKKANFSKVAFKDLQGIAEQNIHEASKAIAQIEKECSRFEAEIASLSSERSSLETFFDYLTIQRDRKKALANITRTDSVFIMEGWLPEHLGGHVQEMLMKNWDCIVSISKPGQNEEFPVLLSNNNLAQSVESITKMYSLPDYKEIDPNKIMAPFFILFFGLMLSDGGYGLVMVAVAVFALWKLPLDESMRRFTRLTLYCGISTIFWGLMFGGWFGITALSNYPLWFNPVEDPEALLAWSLLFGVIHIYAGIGVRGLNLFRQKKYMDIVFDVLTWYVFFTGFVLFVLPYIPKVNPAEVGGLVAIGKYLLIIGGVFLILTQGRDQKNIIMKLLSGLSKLYDLIAFMSDVLSYSRLLALGLATSVIASIINEMGAMGGLDNIF